MYSGLLQLFVELGNLHGTSNYVVYWNHGPKNLNDEYYLLFTCSQDWISNIQMSSLRSSLTKRQYPLRDVSCFIWFVWYTGFSLLTILAVHVVTHFKTGLAFHCLTAVIWRKPTYIQHIFSVRPSLSRWFSWFSPAIHPYRPSLLVGLLDSI